MSNPKKYVNKVEMVQHTLVPTPLQNKRQNRMNSPILIISFTYR